MRKIIVVAVREYQASVKTKAFIASVILMPILMGGAGVMQALLKDRVDTTDKKFAVLDQSGVIYDAIEKAANQYNESGEVFRGEGEDRTKVRPRYLVEKATVAATDPSKYVLELSGRVREKEIFGFVMIGADVVQPGDDPAGVLATGAAYELRHVMDLTAEPVSAGTWTGGSITVPMVDLPVVQPIGEPNAIAAAVSMHSARSSASGRRSALFRTITGLAPLSHAVVR